MHSEQLKKMGLTDGEARVYLALLEVGLSTVGPIAKKSKVAYSKIYEVLDRLLEKGLVSYSVKAKTKYFQALEPVRLKEYMSKKRDELEENEKILNNLIPSLTSLSNKEQKQGAEIFIGEKGVMTAYDILLEKANPNSILRFFYMHDPKYDDRVFDFYYGRINYNNKKVSPILKSKKMEWRGIVNNQNIGKTQKTPPKQMPQRYVTFPVPGNINITDNSILITIWTKEPMAILIQSEEVAENFRNYFDSVWELAKK